MKVAKLTIAQKNELFNAELQPGWFFNPIIDGNMNWIITQIEINNCTNPNFEWIKELPLTDYIPVIEYKFLQYSTFEDADERLTELWLSCLKEQLQISPYPIRSNNVSSRDIIGFAIIINDEILNCLTQTEKDNILISSTEDIIISI